MAQTQAAKEVIWLHRLVDELAPCIDDDVNIATFITINADNQGAIALSKDPKYYSRTKHIDVQWHFVREKVERGIVQ